MTVISIIVTESTEQVISGIPRTITIGTNVPSTIFYTLDGTVPTLFSNIYTGPITLAIDKLTIIVNILATDGVNYSPIITETYTTNILHNARLPHSATTAPTDPNLQDLYPFGNPPLQPNGMFLNPGDAGVTVDDPSLPTVSNGFDGAGNANNFTNKPFNSENYNISYSTTNVENIPGNGIGTLPAQVKIKPNIPPSETTQQFTKTFDPRAFVIFQDFSKEDPNDPVQINKQFFTLEDPEKVRDGNNFYVSGLDAPPANGSFLRSHYNPRDNTISYYYLDTWANRWIISKQEFKPTGSFDGNLSVFPVDSKNGRPSRVFEWIPFRRRVLF